MAGEEGVAIAGIMLMGVFYIFWFLFIAFIGVASLALTAFWVWMLVDAVRRDDYDKENDKIMWILVVALIGWIGAVIYYFVIKRPKGQGKKKKKTSTKKAATKQKKKSTASKKGN